MTRQEFDRFVSESGKDILRFCRMNAGGSAEGDDLYKDTMLTLWEQADKLNKNDYLKSYAETKGEYLQGGTGSLRLNATKSMWKMVFICREKARRNRSSSLCKRK